MRLLERLFRRDGSEKHAGYDAAREPGASSDQARRPSPEEAALQRAELRHRQEAAQQRTEEARLRLLRIEGDIRRRAPGGE